MMDKLNRWIIRMDGRWQAKTDYQKMQLMAFAFLFCVPIVSFIKASTPDVWMPVCNTIAGITIIVSVIVLRVISGDK